jgi:mannan polymerase II complex ANP1 subunit
MGKLYINGSTGLPTSRSPSPIVQILPHHRFAARSPSKRPVVRYALLLLGLVVFYTVSRFIPSTPYPENSLNPDSSYLLSEDIPSVRFFDLTDATGSSRGWERDEQILICVPLRDAAPILPLFFSHMQNLTYPHHLLDLAFLVSDCSDGTMDSLMDHLAVLQAGPDQFRRAMVFEKDFGQDVGQGFSDRHGFLAQAPRRKLMAKARNWLVSSGLTAEYSWVYWRDADVESAPATILEVTRTPSTKLREGCDVLTFRI